ncbi:hypothetical protein [Desulfosporosinus meridiei]|uniref:hypothetical protein n=1 Tax=Desulfosporosinus meridiei TaxID=79209 RepID=UPI00130D58A6|nr:hypothetical protein [Desulfosporosinus meridiei]
MPFGVGGIGAGSSFMNDLLKKDLKYTEKYGLDARKVLPDGRIRYYGEMNQLPKQAKWLVED